MTYGRGRGRRRSGGTVPRIGTLAALGSRRIRRHRSVGRDRVGGVLVGDVEHIGRHGHVVTRVVADDLREVPAEVDAVRVADLA